MPVWLLNSLDLAGQIAIPLMLITLGVWIGIRNLREVEVSLDRFIERAITREKPEFARRIEDLHADPRLDQRGERGRHGLPAHHATPQCHGRCRHRSRQMNVDLRSGREHRVGPDENSLRADVEDDSAVTAHPVEELAGEPALDSRFSSSLHSSAARRGEFQPLLGACVIGPRDLRVDACVRWRQVAARVGGRWRAGPPLVTRQQERTADTQLKRETVTDDELRAVFTQAGGREIRCGYCTTMSTGLRRAG